MEELNPAKSNINWRGMESDAEVLSVLKKLLQEALVSIASNHTEEEVKKKLERYFKDQGFPYHVAFNVSSSNQAEQRMIDAMTYSPVSSNVLKF